MKLYLSPRKIYLTSFLNFGKIRSSYGVCLPANATAFSRRTLHGGHFAALGSGIACLFAYIRGLIYANGKQSGYALRTVHPSVWVEPDISAQPILEESLLLPTSSSLPPCLPVSLPPDARRHPLLTRLKTPWGPASAV